MDRLGRPSTSCSPRATRSLGLARSDASAAALEAKGVTVLPRRPRRPRRAPRGRRRRRRRRPPRQQARLGATRRRRTPPSARGARPSARPSSAPAGRSCSPSGVAGLAQGRPGTEEDAVARSTGPTRRAAAARTSALEYVDRGVRTVSVRFAPTVHGDGDHGFIALIAAVAREKGVVGLRRRRHEPLVGGAPLGRRPARPARARAGAGRVAPARRGRGGRPHEGDRGGHRPRRWVCR